MYSVPNGEQEQALEGEASGGDSGEWTSDGEGVEEAMTQVMEKKSSHLLAGRGGPNLTKNGRAPVKRRLLKLVSLRSVLGPLRQLRLEKRQSTPKS